MQRRGGVKREEEGRGGQGREAAQPVPLSVPLGGAVCPWESHQRSPNPGQEALGTQGGGVPRKPLASGTWRPEQCGVSGHAGCGQVVMAPGGGLYAASHSVFKVSAHHGIQVTSGQWKRTLDTPRVWG